MILRNVPLNKAVHSSIALRFISLMRHSPHQKREQTFFGIRVFLFKSALFFYTAHCLRTKKSTTPGNLMSETVPASAPPGARTLHTLKALGHFISVYYALFCVIKMPAIPLFIGHCEQYKTLWYFIIKCKKFKCLWEGF